MYRILEMIPERKIRMAPCDLNYKIEVIPILRRTTTMVQGRLTNVTYKNSNDEDVLTVDITYNSNTKSTTYPLERTTTRKWYDVAGICHEILDFDKTVRTKEYSIRQTLDEAIVRRTNIVDHLFVTASTIGYATQANDRVKNNSGEIASYKLTGDTAIIDVVNADTASWLNDASPINPSITMKQMIVGALTI